MRNIFATLATLTGLVLLLGLRFVGAYSHQAFAVVLIFGLGWAIASRVFLWRRGDLHRADNRARWIQAGGRGAFWVALGLCVLVIFPRSAEMTGFIIGLGVIAVLRLAASALVSERTNLGPTILMSIAAVILLVDLGRGFVGYPEPQVRIDAPFEGEWLVLQGGRSPMQSHHLTAYNQEFAIDLLAFDEDDQLFREAEGNAATVSWGQPLLAPIEGRVVAVRGDVEDSEGLNLTADKDAAAGNYVVIDDGEGRFVLLAHLQHGSVSVAKGDEVQSGQPIGRCGNSGNTTVPHLHLQVQTHPDLWDPDNRSVPFTIGDRSVLKRNDRVSRE